MTAKGVWGILPHTNNMSDQRIRFRTKNRAISETIFQAVLKNGTKNFMRKKKLKISLPTYRSFLIQKMNYLFVEV